MAHKTSPSGKDIDDWARELYQAFKRSVEIHVNEDEMREHVHTVIFPAVLDLFDLKDFQVTGERMTRTVEDKAKFYDKLYGGVVVEWEWKMDARRRREGSEQALDSLGNLRRKLGRENVLTAVVCDGIQWGFLAIDPPEGPMSLFDEAEINPISRFEWRENSEEACRRFLELVGSDAKGPVTAKGLASAFGPVGECARTLVALLSEALGSRQANDKMDTLYREWRRSLEVAYGDLDARTGKLTDEISTTYYLVQNRPLGEQLFSLHTYFALVARLIAIEVLAISLNDRDSQPTNWLSLSQDDLLTKLTELDHGEIPSGLDTKNLFEGDVFSWYLSICQGNVDLIEGIREVINTIDRFAFPLIAFGANPALDILRDLYQVLVPRSLRRALGEFLTPVWLANSCLERLRSETEAIETGRILDATCGTGTFLLPILHERVRQLRSAKGDTITTEDVQGLLDTVVGFDINPVAVIAARVNYLIALGDLASIGPLTLPVWRTDSIRIPEPPPKQEVMDNPKLHGKDYRLVPTSLAEPFPVPTPLSTEKGLPKLRRIIESTIEEGDPEEGREEYLYELDKAFGPMAGNPLELSDDEWEGVCEVGEQLYGRIRELRDEDRNGVWASIIENSFAPLFEDRFDVIVGNPPWLTWTRLPELWRSATQYIWQRYGLWKAPFEPGERQSLASTDMATLVFAVALDRYLKDKGVIGLLTPDSLLKGDPGGRAFRKFHFREQEPEGPTYKVDIPFRALHVDDWTKISPFAPEASNNPVFIVARKGEPQRFPVPTTRWVRMEKGKRLSGDWHVVKYMLRAIEGESNPVNREVPYSAWSFQRAGTEVIPGGTNKWEFGKGLDTRGANGIFFVEVVVPVTKDAVVRIKNDPNLGRDDRVRMHEGHVESQLIYPLLRGHEVGSWKAHPTNYVIAPYDPDVLGELLDDSALKRFPLARRWLRWFKPLLSIRKPPPNRGWNMDGDDWLRLDGPFNHIFGDHIVVVREMEDRPSAAVITARFDKNLGRTTAPLADHKLLFCCVDSKEEAIYLAAFINSTPIQDLLDSFANKIAVSPLTMKRLPIPDFVPSAEVTAIVRCGEAILAADDTEAEIKKQQGEINGNVLRLIETNAATSRPAKTRRRPKKGSSNDTELLL